MTTDTEQTADPAVQCSDLLGLLLCLFLYGIQNSLAVAAVLREPASHFGSVESGCGNDLHKPDPINDTDLERGNRENLFCVVGHLLRGPDTILMPGQSHLQAKFSNMSPVILAAIEPLTEQNKAPSNKRTDKPEQSWVNFYHGMIGVVVGYIVMTLVYLRWPDLWPNEKGQR